jgi:hypothetical protein
MDGFRLLLAYCVLVAFARSTNLDLGLKIALHAQSKSSLHGWVAGSEVTTRGLRRAFLKRADVSIVEIFAPFCYEGAQNFTAPSTASSRRLLTRLT